MSKHALRVAVVALSMLAAAVWLGGILVLGAIVAPIVFHIVHAPDSADAMTRVFLTFDKVAMSCAVVIALTEAARSRLGSVGRVDLLRLAAAVLASILAFTQGLWLSPRIDALHTAGAIRNVGELGLALESVHKTSELCGKTEALAIVVFIVLAVMTMHQPGAPTSAKTANS